MTLPWSDPAFNNANIAALRVAEHRGDLDYLAPALSGSGDRPLPAGIPGPLSGTATVDANRPAPPPIAEGSTAAPPTEPGRRSLTREQLAESARIQQMVRAFWARERKQ